MNTTYLVGPVTASNADLIRRLGELGPAVVTFSDAAPADIEGVRAVLYLADDGPLPPKLRDGPDPVVALAADWPTHWHRFRNDLPGCDLVLTDEAGAEAFAQAGLDQVRPSVAGWASRSVSGRPEAEPGLDLLVTWEGEPPADAGGWLGRVAPLRDRWRVEVRTGGDLPAARAVLVLGHPVVWPAAAVRVAGLGGVPVFPAAADLPLADGREFLAVSLDDDPAFHLDRLLADAAECRAMADAARRQLDRLHAHFWDEVEAALSETPGRSRTSPLSAVRPDNWVAGWNQAEQAAVAGDVEEAIAQARRTLAAIDGIGDPPADLLDGEPDAPTAGWERAGWANAGRPADEVAAKRAIVRARLHALLADLTGDLSHAYEAALGDPTRPAYRTRLGLALARAGRPAQGIEHLRAARRLDPFAPAGALHAWLARLGHDREARQLAAEQAALRDLAPTLVGPEGWFAPSDAPLVSIVVLCCGQLPFTQLCLESVLRNTRRPFELVLIDNGSADGTADYLRSLAGRAEPSRVEVIANPANRGFPAGCNQGLARAAGEYVVFLNNDTIVPPGWLDPLVMAAAGNTAGRALVGPVSNHASPPHLVAAGYGTLDGIDPYAARRRSAHRGKVERVPRLSAFCLLGRRDFLAELGGFDEGYGLGLFDDDDLCLRARAAGAELLLAADAFVHHYGSRTFRGLAVDGAAQLAENFRRFADCWGPAVAAGYHFPPPADPPRDSASALPASAVGAAVARRARPGNRVSLCMIVKNEEARLADCLGSVADLVDEVVVVDTGSTDRTKAVAVGFGAVVFDFPWCDSFAAARNESLRRATGDWVFWMDADDYLAAADREKFRKLTASLPDRNAAYVMRVVSAEAGAGSGKVVDHVRLFRNHPAVRWEYRVHEQILRAVVMAGGREEWTDVTVRHTGYQDAAACSRKHERNLRLLHLDDAERPDDPFTLFNLGWTYQVTGRHAEAVGYLERGAAVGRPDVSFMRKLHSVLVNAYRWLGRPADALAGCGRALDAYPDDAELLYQHAMLSYEAGDRAAAERDLRRLMGPREANRFAIGVDEGLAGYLAKYNLGVVARDLGRPAEAERLWREAVAERPDYTAAWLALGELLAADSRWDELDETIRQLAADPARGFEELLVRARGAIAKKDSAAALADLARAAAWHSGSVWPPLLRSHLHLQDGDLGPAELALREVLAIDPNHHQSRSNLEKVQAATAGQPVVG